MRAGHALSTAPTGPTTSQSASAVRGASGRRGCVSSDLPPRPRSGNQAHLHVHERPLDETPRRVPPREDGVAVTATASAAAMVAFTLGARHGIDADHLAAIDALTRDSHLARRGYAAYCGALFSAGHSTVILVVAVLLSLATRHWMPPGWLEDVGRTISATVLIGLGAYNLATAVRARSDRGPVGLKAGPMAKWLRCSRAWQVALVGVAFAVSFDSVALGALFSAAAPGLHGAVTALGLALCFSVGMISIDGGNGLWLWRLLQAPSAAAPGGQRAMTLAVGLSSIVIGLCVGGSIASARLEQWLSAHELAASVFVLATMVTGYGVARIIAPAEPRPTTTPPMP